MLAAMDSPQYYSPSGENNSNFDYYNVVENESRAFTYTDDEDQKPPLNVDIGLASSCVYGSGDQQLSLLQPSTSSATYYPATMNSSILLPMKHQQLTQQQPPPPPVPYQTNFINSYGMPGSSHPYAASYNFGPPWYRQDFSVKAEQMANLLNRYDIDGLRAVSRMINGREARNRAEKNRRDKLNNSIQELSTMVPHVAESPRRVDKTGVLRFSAHSLRMRYVFGKSRSKDEEDVTDDVPDALCKVLNGFFLTVTCRGQIVLISSSVEQHLGHCQTDLFGQNLLNIAHPDDHAFLKQKLVPTNLATLFESRLDENGEPAIRTQEEEDEIDRRLREDRRDFTVRLARAGPRSEPTIYEVIRLDGCFRRADSAPRGVKANSLAAGLQLIRRSRGRDDTIPVHTMSANDIVFVAFARLIKPPTVQSRLIEGLKLEYKTRLTIDGKIVQVDQRISLVSGYMVDEVVGHSGLGYMHKDDVRWVMVALREMYDERKMEAWSCYRLLCRNGDFIYLKTRGFLEVDSDTNAVRSICCVNTLVPEEEGKRLAREMKNKFSVLINQRELPAEESITEDDPGVEDPAKLERAIRSLITNLQPAEEETNSDMDSDNEGSMCSAMSRKTNSSGLQLVAPKLDEIRAPCQKTFMFAKNITKKDLAQSQSRPSVLQRHSSNRGEGGNGSLQQQQQPQPQLMTTTATTVLNTNENRATSFLHQPSPSSAASTTSFSASDSGYDSTYNIYEQSTSYYAPNERLNVQTFKVLKRPNTNEISDDAGLPAKRCHTILTQSQLSVVGTKIKTRQSAPSASSLIDVLPCSFDALGQSLNDIREVTSLLKDRGTVPSSQISSIVDEHENQQELLQALRTEFEEHFNETFISNNNNNNNDNNTPSNGNLNAITGSLVQCEPNQFSSNNQNNELPTWDEEKPPDEG